MEATHTPGPWVLDAWASGWSLETNGKSVTSEPFDCSDEDARIMAAAPELLDALRGLMNCHTGAAWQTTDVQRRWWLAADAAVKKATGRA